MDKNPNFIKKIKHAFPLFSSYLKKLLGDFFVAWHLWYITLWNLNSNAYINNSNNMFMWIIILISHLNFHSLRRIYVSNQVNQHATFASIQAFGFLQESNNKCSLLCNNIREFFQATKKLFSKLDSFIWALLSSIRYS